MLSEFRSTNITWDKATSRIYSPVTANASDENGRKLVVQVVNGGQVEDLTGATVHLYWETRDKVHDGLDVFKAVDLKKGEFELSYTTGMLSNKGVLNANLVLIDTVGRVVSERFKITVTEGIDNDAIQSENSFSSLTQALIDISNLEQNYAPRLNDLTAQLQQTEQELSSQLAQTEQKVKQIINIESFGASVTNTEAENDISIQNAINSMVKGDELLIPQGVYEINNITFNAPSECSINCIGTLISKGTGICFKIGDELSSREKYTVKNLKVVNDTLNWISGDVGVKLVNLYSSDIEIQEITGFANNLLVEGNDFGFSYNTITLGMMLDSKENIIVQRVGTGWANENNWYGGRFQLSSAVTDYADCVHLQIKKGNNNRFYSPSFETSSDQAKALIVDYASYNAIIHPRFEANAVEVWADSVEFTTNSLFNTLMYGYTTSIENILDSGTGNRYFTNDGISISSGNANHPTLKLQALTGNAYKQLSVYDVSNKERFYVKGSGEVYSYQHGYFQNGIRFYTSDGSETDRGIFTGGGSPEGVVSATIGSIYLNRSGSPTLFVKESGAGSSGWVAK